MGWIKGGKGCGRLYRRRKISLRPKEKFVRLGGVEVGIQMRDILGSVQRKERKKY